MATTTANLNLRAGPGKNYPILTVIHRGETVKLKAVRTDGWCRVTYSNKEGYCAARFLDITQYDAYVADALVLTEKMLGLWYHFGENFDQPAFGDKRGDCSGFVGWVSRVNGYQPGSLRLYNYSADEMFDNFSSGKWEAQRIKKGEEQPLDFVFYGYGDHASHVVFALGNGKVRGASGGFRATRTDADAKRVGAKVRDDDIDFHKHGVIGIFRPPYGE